MNDRLGLTGCQIAIRLDTIVYSPHGNILTQERHYYVTSLSPDIISAHGLLRLIRNHWQIENSLHFVKDRWWDEDRHWMTRAGLATVFAALTNAALSALRLMPDRDPILRAAADSIKWSPAPVVTALGFK